MKLKGLTHVLLLVIFLCTGLIVGCSVNSVEDAQADLPPEVMEKVLSRYCKTSTATWQRIEIPGCEGRFMVCSFSSIVIEHPPDCDLPDLYCVIGINQDGISCVEIE
jgi:hypothetical protein